MALRSKQEEIGELNVRKELAEKKLSTTMHESEISVEKLQVIYLNNKFFIYMQDFLCQELWKYLFFLL